MTEASTAGTRRIRDVLLKLLAPVVLAVVAVNQVYLATAGDLSPWRGGGFGMFSTADRPEHRAVRTGFVVGGDVVPADVPALLQDPVAGLGTAFLEVKTLPDERRIAAWVDVLSASGWEERDGVIRPTGTQQAAGEGDPQLTIVRSGESVQVEAVVVEVWRPEYDRSLQRAVPSPVTRRVVPVGEPRP
jgi:hypothetical protein